MAKLFISANLEGAAGLVTALSARVAEGLRFSLCERPTSLGYPLPSRLLPPATAAPQQGFSL